MTGEAAADRVVAQLDGADALGFLQGLVSNDVLPLQRGPGLVWAALLTPQGKYLADFFVGRLPAPDTAAEAGAAPAPGALILDLPAALAEPTLRRLALYRLRADVRITPSALKVRRGLGPLPAGALADPRHPALGWRSYATTPGSAPVIDWTAIRVEHLIPEAGAELIPEESYLLEQGFERLHGVDFRKGCYVGQEVTARMKHKTELRKGLVRVRLQGEAAAGTEILAEGKPAGILHSRSGDRALAYLRLDRAAGPMTAGAAQVSLDG
jgi:folate-binding protein YgfZ